MGVSYKKLWKMLIDRDMSKTDLIKKAGISTNAMAHMGKNEDVRVEVLAKICCALDCTMNDIMDVIPDEIYKNQDTEITIETRNGNIKNKNAIIGEC